MVGAGDRWRLVEAKSARTLDASFLRHLNLLTERLGEGACVERRLVYGGDAPAKRSGTDVLPWRDIQRVAWD
jgi:hypothetical protein